MLSKYPRYGQSLANKIHNPAPHHPPKIRLNPQGSSSPHALESLSPQSPGPFGPNDLSSLHDSMSRPGSGMTSRSCLTSPIFHAAKLASEALVKSPTMYRTRQSRLQCPRGDLLHSKNYAGHMANESVVGDLPLHGTVAA